MRKLIPILACMVVALSFCACGGDNPDCDALIQDATACLDGWCTAEGKDSAFCGCWSQGKDMNQYTCECIKLDWSQACSGIDNCEPGSLNCDDLTSDLANITCN